MGLYSTISPISGKLYDFRIEGETPNQEELDKIQNYISNDGLPPQTTDVQAKEDDNLFTTGIGRGVDLIQQSYGSSLEGIGKKLGLEGLQEYGASVAENNEKELQESAKSSRQLADIDGVGGFIDYMSANLGQQLPNLAPSLAGGYAGGKAGALAGSFLGPAGTAIGGTIGAITGAIGANIPFFYGQNREAQKEEIEKGNKIEIDEGAAFLASIPQAAFDAVADRFLVRGFMAPLVSGGGLFTRGVKGIGLGIITETPTEIGQQVLERAQAGKDLLSEEAMDEYIEVGVAAGLLGGTIRGSGEIVGGKRATSKTQELSQDLTLMEQQAQQRAKNYQELKGMKAQTVVKGQEEGPQQEPVQQAEPFKEKLGKQMVQTAVDNKVAREQADPTQAARETRTPFKPVPLADLPKDEALRIAQLRQRTGTTEPSADVTIDELESSIGPESAQRERVKQKPILSQGKALFERQIFSAQTDEDIQIFAEDAAYVTTELAATGRLNVKNLQNILNITKSEAEDTITFFKDSGYVKDGTKGKLVKDDDNIVDLKTESEAVKSRAEELIALQKDVEKNRATIPDADQQLDAFAQEYLTLQDEAAAIEKASNLVYGKAKNKYSASKIVPDYTAKRTSDKTEKADFTDAYKLKLTSVMNALKTQLKDMGLKDISLEGESIVENDASIEGYFSTSPNGKRVIGLAMDLYDPNLTEAQLTEKLGGVMNHELIHALKDMNFFSEQEYSILVNAANKRKYVTEINGQQTTRKYTYMERAVQLYQKKSDGTDYTKEEQAEEAIAEMYRDYAAGRLSVVGKPKSLFDKIARFIRAIFTSHIDTGFAKTDEIFENIKSTNLEEKIKQRASIPAEAKSKKKHSTAGVVAGYIRPELGNIQRIKQSFKDVTTRIDALTKASEKLYQGKIDYAQYDKLVNDVKPIVPYETVPAPATVNEMREALAGEKKKAIINKLQEIPEGTRVKLRLDIPAYTTKGTWVPTIHNMAGKAISHESTAIITNADFTMSEADQNKGLDIARRKPFGAEFRETGDITKAKRMTKTPYATISGDLVQTTPDNSFAEAQAAMNDPTFVQVGFDPERHSYFYDRTTTQPVVSADRVIQVGPLVLAKNPVFEGKEQFKYSKTSSELEGLENRLIGFIKDNPDGFTIDPDTFFIPSKGKAVAPVKAAEIVTRPELITPSLIRDYAKNVQIMTKIAGSMSLNNKVYAGGWLNKKTKDNPKGDGLFYLDATMVIEDTRDALYTAEAGNQKAIFDLGEFYETVTEDGIQKLKQDRSYSGDRRARIGTNIRQYSQEFIEARRQDISGQRIDKKYSAIAKARNTQDQYNRPLIESTIVDEYDSNNNIVPQPEYQTNPEQATPAKEGRVLKIDALANHQKKRGDVVYDIHSKDITEREANRERVSIMLAAEAEKALQRDGNAIGWYGRTLDKTKKLLSKIIYPDINKPDHKLAFDFALAVTSNGMGVVDNFGYAAEQYEAWVNTGKFPIIGWGDRASAMEHAFKFYNSMIKAGATTEQFNAFMNQSTTVGELASDKFIVKTGVNVPSQESVNTPVNGSYVIGAKIGQGFYQNLIGNFDNLTQDIWFMRTMNRLTGSVFKKPVTQRTFDRNYDRVLLAIDGKKQSTKLANPATENPLTDLDIDLLERTKKALSIDMIPQDEDALYLFTDQFNREYERFRNRTQKSEAAKLGVKPSKIKLPVKTELQLASQTYYDNRTTLEQQDPRSSDDRQAMREIVVRSREILKQETGIDISNADFQALVWYAEKQLFAAQGVQKGRGDDNDYLDGAIFLAQAKGIDNETISETLTPADRESRLYSRASPYGRDGQFRERVTGELSIESETDTENQGLDETDAIYDFVDPARIKQAKDDGREIKYSILSSMFAKDPSLSFVDRPMKGLETKFGDVLGNIEVRKKQREARNNPAIKLFGLIENNRGNLEHVVVQEGEHADLGNGRYRGFGLAHIRGKRLNKEGRPVLTHEQEILRNHNYPSVLHAIEDMLRAYKTQRANFNKKFYDELRDNMGIKVEPDGGIGNNDVRIEWTKGKNKDGSDNKLVMSLKYDNSTLKKGGLFGKPVQVLPIYTVRTMFSTPQQSEKRKRSQISTTPVSQVSPNSAQISQDIEDRRQKVRYDNLSGIIAKGLGFIMPADVASEKATNLLIGFQDAMLPVGTLMDNLREKGIKITDAVDTYLREELYQGIAGDKVEKVQKELFEPFMAQIRGLNISDDKIQELKNIKGAVDLGFFGFASEKYASQKLAVVDAILYARHALERNKFISDKTKGANSVGSGMTNAEANQILNWVENLPQIEKAKIDDILASAKKINDNTIQQRIDSGLLPQDTLERDRSDPDSIIVYDNYVPLQGDLDIEQEKLLYDEGYGRKRRVSNYFGIAGKEDKSAKGRKYDNYAQNIVASLMAQNNNSIARGERNKVGLSFLNLTRGQEEQADGSTATNATLIKEMENIAEDVSGESLQSRRGRGIDPDNELILRENGAEKILFIKDARIARAMKGALNPHQSNKLVRAMGKFNRYLSAINTTYNPSFVIPNLFRDLEAAGVNIQQYDEKGITSEITKGAFGAIRGIVKELRTPNSEGAWSEEYRKFVEAGGKNATNQMSDLQDQMENVKGLLDDISESSIKQKFGLNKGQFVNEKGKSVIKLLDDVNTAVENGVRVATFKALKERGMTASQAAQAARNVTVNFAKGGEHKAMMNSMYLFYNASLQGSMALVNSAIKSPTVRKVWGGLVLYGMLQDQINGLLSGDEDEDGIKDYDELPKYILEHNLVLPTFGLMDDKFVTIPLSYGLNMAVNFGRALSRTARGEYTAGEATSTIVGTAVESLSPIGAFDHFLTFFSPTVADPFISVAINEDYKGDPIYKESPTFSSTPKPDSQQSWSSTGRIPKFIANALNKLTGGDEVEGGFADFSPDAIEFWMDYLTGGTGRFVQRSAEMPANIVDLLKGDLEVSVWSTIPLARKVIASPSARQDTGNYLDNRQDLFTILARVDLARKSGNTDEVVAMYDKYKKELSIAGRLKAIDNARNRMVRQIREIEKNPRIPEDTKQNIIRIRKEKIRELQQMGIILMRSAGFKKAS